MSLYNVSAESEADYRRGNALHSAGDFAGALAAYDVALRGCPQAAILHYSRGNALMMLRRVEEGIGAYDRCLALEPNHPQARYNRATALVQLQRWQEALEGLDILVRSHPRMADAWNNRSGVLQALGRFEEALESLKPVLQLRPMDARAFYNAGIMLLALNRFDEAQAMLSRSYQLDPGHSDALGCLVSAALRACDWAALDYLLPTALDRLRQGRLVIPPVALLALSDDPMLQRYCAERNLQRSLADTELGSGIAPAMARQAYGHAKIRIGYLSSDFGNHPVTTQIVKLLERHDRSRLEVSGFFTGRADGSDKYRRLVKACDQFHVIGHLGSREGAALIHEAEIDILVDLNGQTMGWRPAILAYRPAPVIATYLGYAGTMAGDFVDYIIGDPHVTPFEMAPAFAEQIVQLNCFWPSDPGMPQPEPVSRAELGLPENGFVFCCFNANHKIRPAVFEVWMRLLTAVPDSVLWLREASPAMNERLRQQARARGIDSSRLHFAPRMSSFARHLGRHAAADLFLDTWPYNAHATASDALWAGLPVLALRGQSFVSRVSSSFLANLGLAELIASSLEDYEAKALSLAQDRARLANIRERLAAARKAAPLFDMSRFTRDIEAAYAEMYRRAQRGEPPAPLKVIA